MLSTMTTSENFPLNQSGCPRETLQSVIQPTYVATILRQKPQIVGGDDENVLNFRIIQEGDVGRRKLASSLRYFPAETKEVDVGWLEVDSVDERKGSDFLGSEVPKTELENDLTDLLEQLELDDSAYCEQSKPLKIDPNVLKLDFSKLSIEGRCEALDKLCSSDFSENKRASHHLSGGGLLTDASQEDFRKGGSDFSKNGFPCKLSGGGLMATENVFNFEDLPDLEFPPNGVCNFLNQISPSSPLTFDLTQSEQGKNVVVTSGISSDGESTNPFKNFIKGVLEEDEKSFSPTNPFTDFRSSSSLNEIPSINCLAPVARYENLSIPQKTTTTTTTVSFPQCSPSPGSQIPEETAASNPFLVNETSLEQQQQQQQQPSEVGTFFVSDSSNFQNAGSGLPKPSSFIFAVPVFPIFQHNITNSSTQTGDLSESPRPEERVYQNVTNQLEKFMKRNDHSEYDLQCLKTTVKDLRDSGWYYENVSWQESVDLLKSTEPGTFLIRDSSDPNFLFSLSVQTSRGPTSVRLHYVNGQFRLDAEKKLIPHMPSFNSVIELIDYYVENTVKNKSNNKVNKSTKKPGRHKLQKSKDQVWIDSQGNIYSNILLVKPLCKREHFSSLQHLARLTINRYIKKKLNAKVKYNFRVTPVYESSPFQDSSFQNNFDNFCPILSIDALPLPSKLLEFLKEYPYCH